MVYKKEKDMYPDVVFWLKKHLEEKFKSKKILVSDTSSKNLSSWLYENKLDIFFEYSETFEIQVDITGAIIDENKNSGNFSFIECKLNKISLKDISQLIGYSKVARPVNSIILSPEGYTDAVNNLFVKYRRYDILEYQRNRRIIVAKWDEGRKSLDNRFLIPRGTNY
ncbi:MAG: hypothetical protein HeimC3_53790 [Candidatus Heimdallarchaeota archaeon LC_3]|nr:MAG: hypothetical protein HeimC3_53790 [Candidatus Heimdallarchaeota archaeon LC_3]